jgi:hypothetical protein
VTRGELRAYARRLLAEQIASTSFWSDADLNDYLNRALEQFVSLTGVLRCISTVPSDVTLTLYPLPQDTLRVLRIYYAGRAEPLDDATIEWLDNWDRTWPTLTATSGQTPTWWAPFGQGYFLVPKPAASGELITLWCVQAPTPLSADTGTGSVPPISTAFHEALATGAAIRALAQDRTNPDNVRAIKTLTDLLWTPAIVAAQSYESRKSPHQQMRDIRDLYPQEWRP